MIDPMRKRECHDCLPCHFEYEEKYARIYLPLPYRQWLFSEHARIRAGGYDPMEVLLHAEQEMPIFRRYFPDHVIRQIEIDHKFHGPRLMAQAQAQRPRPAVLVV